jgi:hypothetical protein
VEYHSCARYRGLVLQRYLSQRIATVDEHSRVWVERSDDAFPRSSARLGMTPIERPNAHRQRDVEWRLPRQQLEILCSHTPKAQQPELDLRPAGRARLLNRGRRPVDSEDVPLAEPARNLPRSRTGATPNFQDTHALSERKGIDYRAKT